MKSSVITLPPVIVIVIVRHIESLNHKLHNNATGMPMASIMEPWAWREIKRINNWFGTVPEFQIN